MSSEFESHVVNVQNTSIFECLNMCIRLRNAAFPAVFAKKYFQQSFVGIFFVLICFN